MEYRKLGKTNELVSVLGFGASPLGNVFDICEEQEGINTVHHAINHGVNFFDVSPFYGITLAETRLGKALLGKRKDVFLATKCGRYDLRAFDFSAKRIMASIDESLQRLQTDYVDLFQLHDIEFVTKEQILNEAMPAIEKIKASGKTRFIGISGLPVRYLATIAKEVELDTVLSWAHYNLLQNEINNELVPLSKEKGFGFGAQMLDFDKPSYTIPARYWKDGYDALVKYNEKEIRRLTITELKRIQSFPDNYIIDGSSKDIIMQIGNAVACKFAYYLGKYIINTLQ